MSADRLAGFPGQLQRFLRSLDLLLRQLDLLDEGHRIQVGVGDLLRQCLLDVHAAGRRRVLLRPCLAYLVFDQESGKERHGNHCTS